MNENLEIERLRKENAIMREALEKIGSYDNTWTFRFAREALAKISPHPENNLALKEAE
jgi:hypothetical protein